MSARVTWAQGGEAGVVSIGADAVVLRSTVPSPPGSRIEGRVEGPADVPGAVDGGGAGRAPLSLRVKVHGCKRQGEGEFMIVGRPIDLSREARDRLEAWVRGQ
jgi:hypothetical protein